MSKIQTWTLFKRPTDYVVRDTQGRVICCHKSALYAVRMALGVAIKQGVGVEIVGQPLDVSSTGEGERKC